MPDILFITVNPVPSASEQSFIDLIDGFGVDYSVTQVGRNDLVSSDFLNKSCAVVGQAMTSITYDLKNEDIPILSMARNFSNTELFLGSGTSSSSLDQFNLRDNTTSMKGTYSNVGDLAVVFLGSQLMWGITGFGAGVIPIWSNSNNATRAPVVYAPKGAVLADSSTAVNVRTTFIIETALRTSSLTNSVSPSGGVQLFKEVLDFTLESSLEVNDTLYSDRDETIPYTGANVRYWALSKTTNQIESTGTVDPGPNGEIQIEDPAITTDNYIFIYESDDEELLGAEHKNVS